MEHTCDSGLRMVMNVDKVYDNDTIRNTLVVLSIIVTVLFIAIFEIMY